MVLWTLHLTVANASNSGQYPVLLLLLLLFIIYYLLLLLLDFI